MTKLTREDIVQPVEADHMSQLNRIEHWNEARIKLALKIADELQVIWELEQLDKECANKLKALIKTLRSAQSEGKEK